MVKQASSEARRAHGAISLVFLVNGAILGSWIPHIATVQQNLHLTKAHLGIALLASPIGAVATMPFAPLGIHRFGSRNTVLGFGLALCGLLPMIVSGNTLLQFAIPLLLFGILNGQMDVGMNAHSMAVQSRIPRPIISSVHGWFSIGGFLGGGGAALAAKLGIAPVVHLAIAGATLGTLLVASWRALLPARADTADEAPQFSFPRGSLLVVSILTFLAFLSEGALWDWTAVYMRAELQSGEALGAMTFAVFSLSMAAGRFVGDRIVHRFERGRGGRTSVLVLGSIVASMGVLLTIASVGVEGAMAGFALAGFGLANVVPLLFYAAGNQANVSAGAGLAAATTCGYSAFLIGPPLVGFVADRASLATSLAGVAALFLLIAVGARYARLGQ